MKLENIAVGMTIPNYRALCNELDEPIKTGNAKRAQLKEWERYFSYTKSGNAFIITEVFSVPKPMDDKRFRYTQYIEPILLNYLSNMPVHENTLSYARWFQVLGMTSCNINESNLYERFEAECSHVNAFTFQKVMFDARKLLKAVLKNALESMQKRGYVSFRTVVYIFNENEIRREATPDEVRIIEQEKRALISELGYRNSYSIYINANRTKQYFRSLNERLLSKYHWSNIYEELYICSTEDITALYAGIDTSEQRNKLNREICSQLIKIENTNLENNQQKGLEAWEADEPFFSYPPFMAIEAEEIVNALVAL